MSTKEAYKQKIDALLKAEILKFGEFKDQAEKLPTDARNRHAEHVEAIERKVDAAKSKLKELEEIGEDTWEQLIEGIEHTWTTLQSTVEDAVASFKHDHEQNLPPVRAHRPGWKITRSRGCILPMPPVFSTLNLSLFLK